MTSRNAKKGSRVYVDFGIRKRHAVLMDDSPKPLFIEDLASLQLKGCAVFLEEGCPKGILFPLVRENRIFMVRGDVVSEYRARRQLRKTDANDACLIRELSQNRPLVFRELERLERAELLTRMDYAYYCKLSSLLAGLRNRRRSFLREVGEVPRGLTTSIAILRREKKAAASQFSKFDSSVSLLAIKGAGPRLVGGVLLCAHPRNFRSLSAYLAYAGFKGWSSLSGKYNRHVKSLYYQLGAMVIIHRDPRFYRIYVKIKRDLQISREGLSAGRLDGMARNRLCTFLAKEFYRRFSVPKEPSS